MARAHEPHEARKAYHADVARTQRLDELAIEVVARLEGAVADVQRLDARLPRAVEAVRLRTVRDDDGNRGVERAVADGVDDRLQVAAATRDEDAEPSIHFRFE
jgi:hypothetical protein